MSGRTEPPRSSSETRLLEAIDGLTHANMRIARREATSAGLSMPQFFMLRRIHHQGPIPSTGWAKQTGIRASTASGLVDGLVRGGWAERSPDPDDRRRVLVRLTDRGERRLDTIGRARRSAMLEALGPLPREDVVRAADAVEELVRRLGDGGSHGAGAEPSNVEHPPRPTRRSASRREVPRAG
jgi:DNA-binding MarR family transcriptional regulator